MFFKLLKKINVKIILLIIIILLLSYIYWKKYTIEKFYDTEIKHTHTHNQILSEIPNEISNEIPNEINNKVTVSLVDLHSERSALIKNYDNEIKSIKDSKGKIYKTIELLKRSIAAYDPITPEYTDIIYNISNKLDKIIEIVNNSNEIQNDIIKIIEDNIEDIIEYINKNKDQLNKENKKKKVKYIIDQFNKAKKVFNSLQTSEDSSEE